MSRTGCGGRCRTSYRSHCLGCVTSDLEGERVCLSGWVHNIRDLGGLVFVDLRDHYGILQLVVDEERLKKGIKSVSLESSIQAKGVVQKKPGEEAVEVKLEEFRVLSSSDELPFPVNHVTDVGETLRLRNRFLQLRRSREHSLITNRSRLIKLIRDILYERGFLEIQTPILTGTSPEGARDFLVPSRRFKGKFYALPQAPQQFKQLLMMSGFDKYFQIAPCFRDEDPRADRHAGEFYQIDAEMAFVSQEDVLNEFESFFIELLERFGCSKRLTHPFYMMSFEESCIKTGSDKPDMRAKVTYADISELSDLIKAESLRIQEGEALVSLHLSLQSMPSRSQLDKISDLGRSLLNRSALYCVITDQERKGTILKFVEEEFFKKLFEKVEFRSGTVNLYIFLKRKKSLEPSAEKFRVEVSRIFGQFTEDELAFCWVTYFPFFELDEDGNLQFCHNPFSMPVGGLEALKKEDPLSIKAYQYDLALNGYELSSGAIRNHELETLLTAFEMVGYSREKTLQTFPGITKALMYGPPPHGGMAPGIERLLMVLFDEPNVREVIPFPLTQNGEDLLMNAPSEVEDARLRELGITLSSLDQTEKEIH